MLDSGLQSCSFDARDLEKYKNSRHCMKREWDAAKHNIKFRRPEWRKTEELWAEELIAAEIDLEFGYSPIERKEHILTSLRKGQLILCNVGVLSPAGELLDETHVILLMGMENQELLVHDPLPDNSTLTYQEAGIRYGEWDGPNLRIPFDYFFDLKTEEPKPLKPELNPYDKELGATYLRVSSTRKNTEGYEK